MDPAIDAGTTVAEKLLPNEPVKACADLASCAKACKAPSVGGNGCYDAAVFAMESGPDGGPDLTAVTMYAALACDKGDGRGCLRASRPGDAMKVLPAQCERGEAEACELLAGVKTEADAGADAAVAAKRAKKILQDKCEDGDGAACGRLGSALLNGRLGRADPKQALTWLDKACRKGHATSCEELERAR